MENDKNLLQFLIDSGTMNIDDVREKLKNMERQAYLDKHPYKPWFNENDGRWRVYYPDPVTGKRSKTPWTSKSLRKLEDKIIAFQKSLIEKPTVKQIFAEWLSERLRINAIKRATFDRYYCDYNRYFTEIENKFIADISEEDMEEWITETIIAQEMTIKNFNNFKTILFGCFKYARKKKFIDYSITERVESYDFPANMFKIVIKEEDDEVFDVEDFPILLNYLVNSNNILDLGILILLKTGIRVGELAAIKKEFVNFDNGEIKIRNGETKYRDPETGKFVYEVTPVNVKTRKGYRTAIVPEDTLWVLEKILKINPDGEYLICRDGERARTYNFRARLYKVTNELFGKKKSPNKGRKTYVSILLDDNTVPNQVILDLVGHIDISTSERNYHRNRYIKAQHDIINNVKELQCNQV